MKELNYESYKTFRSCKSLSSFKRIITYNVLPHHRLCNDICESVGFFQISLFIFPSLSLSLHALPPSQYLFCNISLSKRALIWLEAARMSWCSRWLCSSALLLLTLNATGLAKCGNRHDSSVIEGKCLKLVLRTLSPEALSVDKKTGWETRDRSCRHSSRAMWWCLPPLHTVMRDSLKQDLFTCFCTSPSL